MLGISSVKKVGRGYSAGVKSYVQGGEKGVEGYTGTGEMLACWSGGVEVRGLGNRRRDKCVRLL